jgi:Tfp pilus assembly protein PilO
MQQDFTNRKRAILALLGLLVAADVALGAYSWHLASAPKTTDREFEAQNLRIKLLNKDIADAQNIQKDMPATSKDCEKFEQSLPPESTGYSAMTSELDDLAKKSGLQIVTLTNKQTHQKELTGRGMAEISIDATVSGGYSSVAKFVNELQRSEKFYIVDSLTLAADMQNQSANGPLHVALHLRTYFREAA